MISSAGVKAYKSLPINLTRYQTEFLQKFTSKLIDNFDKFPMKIFVTFFCCVSQRLNNHPYLLYCLSHSSIHSPLQCFVPSCWRQESFWLSGNCPVTFLTDCYFPNLART